MHGTITFAVPENVCTLAAAMQLAVTGYEVLLTQAVSCLASMDTHWSLPVLASQLQHYFVLQMAS